MKSNIWKTNLVFVIVMLFVGAGMHRTYLGGIESGKGRGEQRAVMQAKLQRPGSFPAFQRSPRR